MNLIIMCVLTHVFSLGNIFVNAMKPQCPGTKNLGNVSGSINSSGMCQFKKNRLYTFTFSPEGFTDTNYRIETEITGSSNKICFEGTSSATGNKICGLSKACFGLCSSAHQECKMIQEFPLNITYEARNNCVFELKYNVTRCASTTTSPAAIDSTTSTATTNAITESQASTWDSTVDPTTESQASTRDSTVDDVSIITSLGNSTLTTNARNEPTPQAYNNTAVYVALPIVTVILILVGILVFMMYRRNKAFAVQNTFEYSTVYNTGTNQSGTAAGGAYRNPSYENVLPISTVTPNGERSIYATIDDENAVYYSAVSPDVNQAANNESEQVENILYGQNQADADNEVVDNVLYGDGGGEGAGTSGMVDNVLYG